MILYTVQESKKLLSFFKLKIIQTVDQLMSWSRWRRKHQAAARFYHYRQNSVFYNRYHIQL